jgi:hypothetical protein
MCTGGFDPVPETFTMPSCGAKPPTPEESDK